MSLVKKSCNIGGVTAEIWIVEIEKEMFMYGGHNVAEFLGYKCPRNALKNHVKPVWKKNWEEIERALNQCPHMTSSDQIQLPANWHPHTVFISEAGVYALIMRSKLPAADEFRSWLFEKVLPELRKTGKYSVQDNITQSSSEVVNYDKKLAEAQMDAMRLKLELSETNTTIANYNTTISEMKRNYEQQMAEYKEREYRMQLQMKDLTNAANMTMTQKTINDHKFIIE